MDLENAYRALKNAHAAGDTEGAKKLATFIKSQQQTVEQPATPKRQVGAGESAVRAAKEFGGKMLDMGGMVLGGGAVLADKAVGALTDNPNATGAQDFIFENVVQPAESFARRNALQADEEYTTGGQLANIGVNVAGAVLPAVGVASRMPAMATAMQRLFQGAALTAPTFALPDANYRAQEMISKGVDQDTIMQAYLSNAGINTLSGALPASLAGNVVKRAGTGAALAVGSGAAARESEAQILGDEYKSLQQDAFGVEESGIEAGIGAVIGALLGARGGAAARTRQPSPDPIVQQPVMNLVTEPEPINLGDVISRLTGAPLNAESPQAAIVREAEAQKARTQKARELNQSQLADQVRLYGDELPPQYTQAPNNEELAVRQAYEEQGIDPDSVANTFARAAVADQMELPQAQRDIKNRENTNLLAKQAFDLAATRQNAADSDLANFDQIAPDYQGGLSAATGGTINGDQRGVFMFGEQQFNPRYNDFGGVVYDKKGNVLGDLVDADGNVTKGVAVQPNKLKEFKASANQRLAQDFMARSTQPRAGVGTGTRAQEKMPLRSTDIISGNEVGGLATRNLADPYTPDARDPSGNVSVEQAPPQPKGLKQPRQGDTIDNEVDTPLLPNRADETGTAVARVDGQDVVNQVPPDSRLPSPDSETVNGQQTGRIRVDSQGRANLENETFAQQQARQERERVDGVIRDYSQNDLGNTAKNVGTTDTTAKPAPVPQKQRLMLAAKSLRDAADNVDGKEKAELTAKAEKMEAQAAKIKDEPVAEAQPTPKADSGFEGGVREVGRIGGKNSTEVLTVRENGDKLDVYYNDEPLVDFNTEENVQVPRGASIDDIKAAVKKADQFGKTIIAYAKDYTPLAGKAADAPTPKAEAQPVKTEPAAQAAEPTTQPQTNEDTVRASKVTQVADTLKAWLPDMDWEVIGGKIIRDADGNVTGRTTWVAKDPEFDAIRSGLNVKFSEMRKAVQKAVDGLPLGSKEKRIVDAVLRMHDEVMKQSDEIQTMLDDAGYTDADVEAGRKVLTDDEINALLKDAGYDERTNATEAQDFTAEGEASRADSNAEQEQGRSGTDDFTLERETNADIERREREVAAREKAVKDAEKAAADKAKADAEVNDFTLTGSDRATDANPNQGDIFSQQQQTVEVPDRDSLAKTLNKMGVPSRALSRNELRLTVNDKAIFPKDKFEVDIELKNGKWNILEFSTPSKYTEEQAGAMEKLRADLDAINNGGKANTYDADVQQTRTDLGMGGGATFYSGLPLDKMYDAVSKAIKALFNNSEFFKRDLEETRARREFFKEAEAADRKAAGTETGGLRRAVEFTANSFNRLITGQTAVLDGLAKKHNSTAIADLAAMFSDRAGTGDAGKAGVTYYQDVEQHFTTRLNDVVAAIGEKNVENIGYWNAVVKRVKAGNFDNTPIGQSAKKVADMLADELERMKARGVEVGNYKGYFPDREINTQVVLHNSANFIKAATAAFVKNGSSLADAKAQAESWHKHVMLGDMDASGSPFMPTQSGSPDTSFTKARSLSNEASQVLRDAGFYFDNPLESLTTYFYRTSRKAAYESRFGGRTKDGKNHAKYRELEQRIIDEGNGEVLEDVRRHIVSLLGEIPSSNIGSGGRKVVSFLQSANVITYLSGVGTVLTSLTEPVIAGARTNNIIDSPKSVYYSVRNIASRSAQKFLPNANWAKNLSTEQSIEVAQMIGVMSNKMLSDAAIQNRLGGNLVNRKADRAVQTALRWNGLHGFTQLTRAASVEVGAEFINSLARELKDGSAGKLNKTLLSEMGVPENKHAEFADYVMRAKKGKYGGLSIDELGKAGEMNELYKNALYKFATQVIQNPNKGQQPRMASHPVGKVAYSLLSYIYSYNENVLKRAGRMAFDAGKDIAKGKDGEYSMAEKAKLLTPAAVAFAVIPLLQMALIPVRDELNGITEEQKEKRKARSTMGVDGETLEAFQRSGVFGRYEPIVNMVLGLRYDREMSNMLLGASGGGLVGTAEKSLILPFDDKNSPNTNTAERAALSAWMATVVEPSIVYMGTKTLPSFAGVPLQLAVKNKNTREAVVDAVAGEKKQKATSLYD